MWDLAKTHTQGLSIGPTVLFVNQNTDVVIIEEKTVETTAFPGPTVSKALSWLET